MHVLGLVGVGDVPINSAQYEQYQNAVSTRARAF